MSSTLTQPTEPFPSILWIAWRSLRHQSDSMTMFSFLLVLYVFTDSLQGAPYTKADFVAMLGLCVGYTIARRSAIVARRRARKPRPVLAT